MESKNTALAASAAVTGAAVTKDGKLMVTIQDDTGTQTPIFAGKIDVSEVVEEELQNYAPISAAIRPTVVGNPAVCEDSVAWGLQGLKIYGKSTQDGTPSPENPVPIVSAGDGGSIDLTVCGSNLLDLSQGRNGTGEGVTFTKNPDGSYQMIGAATGSAGNVWFLGSYYGPNVLFYLQPGTYFAQDCALFYNGKGVFDSSAGDTKFVLTEITPVGGVRNPVMSIGETYNKTIYPAIFTGETAQPWKPYTGKSISVSTPNGLPGVPVESGGNFTDADGQQLVCNFIDLSDGKKHYPVKKYLAEELSFSVNASWTQANPDYAFAYSPLFGSKPIGRAISNTLKSIKLTSHLAINEPIVMVETSSNYSVLYVAVLKSNLSQVSSVGIKSYLTSISAEFIAANTNPDETEEISAEELAAYRALTTYDGATVISTAEPVAGIEARYILDGTAAWDDIQTIKQVVASLQNQPEPYQSKDE